MDEGKMEIDDLKKQVETLNDIQRKQGTKRRRSNASITSSNEDSDDNDKSEQIDHHPKMIIDFDTIEFELSTHSVGGITVLDFELANFIEDTYDELFQSD